MHYNEENTKEIIEEKTNEKIIYLGTGSRKGYLECVLAGVTCPVPEQKEVHSMLESNIFGYVTSGKGYIEINNETHTLTAGDFYFIGKGSSVYCYPDSDEPWEKMWLHVGGTIVEDLKTTFRLDDFVISKNNVRRCFIEIHDILRCMLPNNTPNSLRRISCLLFEILSEVKKDEFFALEGKKIRKAELIKTYLENNVYNDISLDTTAKEFRVSKMHVIRLFKKEFNITPMQYLIDRKLNVAKSLLSGTVMPISEISDLLRFSNTQHFSNSFKKTVGMSPSNYRRSIQNQK